MSVQNGGGGFSDAGCCFLNFFFGVLDGHHKSDTEGVIMHTINVRHKGSKYGEVKNKINVLFTTQVLQY